MDKNQAENKQPKLPINLPKSGKAAATTPNKRKPSARKLKLTPQQFKFCDEILDGKNYSDAYRAAYDVKDKDASWINSEASALANNPKITLWLDYLYKQVEKLGVMGAHETLRRWTQLARRNDVDGLKFFTKYHKLAEDDGGPVQPFKIIIERAADGR